MSQQAHVALCLILVGCVLQFGCFLFKVNVRVIYVLLFSVASSRFNS